MPLGPALAALLAAAAGAAVAPPAGGIVPDGEPVGIRVDAPDGPSGEAIRVRLDAPPRNPLLSTDFPWVEGTALLDMEAIPEGGALSFRLVPPIRGRYALRVSRRGGPEEVRAFDVPENPAEVRNVLVLAALLLAAGLAAGFVIGRSAAARAALAAGLLAAVLGPCPEALAGHGHGGPGGEDRAFPRGPFEARGTDGRLLRVAMEPAAATVGSLLRIRAEAAGADGRPLAGARIRVAASALPETPGERKRDVFEGTFGAPGGALSIGIQLFDGAPHEISVEADGGGAPRVSFPVEVRALSPPAGVALRSFLTLLLPSALGLALGAALGRRAGRGAPAVPAAAGAA